MDSVQEKVSGQAKSNKTIGTDNGSATGKAVAKSSKPRRVSARPLSDTDQTAVPAGQQAHAGKKSAGQKSEPDKARVFVRYQVLAACICQGVYRQPGDVVLLPRYEHCPDHLCEERTETLTGQTKQQVQEQAQGASLEDLGLGTVRHAGDISSVEAL